MNSDWSKLRKRPQQPSKAQLEVQTQLLDSPAGGLRAIRARNGVADPPIIIPASKATR